MAWATAKGFNFRNTLGYVTDGTNQQAVYETAAAYPITQTIGGDSVTFGFDSAASLQYRNRNAGNDVRLAGMIFTENVESYFRVNLPASGDYKVRVAIGDGIYSITNQTILIKDGVGGSTLATFTDASIAGNSFLDAGNTERTAANWPGSNTEITVTFTGTVATLYLPANGAGINSYITSLSLEQVAVAAAGGHKNLLLMGVG